MAKPHKFAWNGIDVETTLTIEQLANMAQRAAQECTGDMTHGKHRIASVKSTDRQIEFRVNDFLITFKKFMVFYLDFEQRGDRVWMSSRISWYVTTQPTVGGFIPVAAKAMVGHHTYMQFVRHLAAQVTAADPQARVTVREGVAGANRVATPQDAAAPATPPPPAGMPGVPMAPPQGRPMPPPLNRPVPPPPPPPSAVPQAAPVPAPPAPPPPAVIVPAIVAPPSPPPLRPVPSPRRAGADTGGLIASVPGMPTRASAAASAEPEPEVGRYASLAEQMFAEDEELYETRLAQAGADALPWVLTQPNGATVVVSGPLVLGRNPSAPPAAPHAVPMALIDPNRSVSKTHALIELREGLPWVTDLNSTNGTTLTNEVGEAVVCVPGAAVPVGDNWQLGLGEYALRLSRRRG